MAGGRLRSVAGDRVVPAPDELAEPRAGNPHRMTAALLWGGLFSVILWGIILAAIF